MNPYDTPATVPITTRVEYRVPWWNWVLIAVLLGLLISERLENTTLRTELRQEVVKRWVFMHLLEDRGTPTR